MAEVCSPACAADPRFAQPTTDLARWKALLTHSGIGFAEAQWEGGSYLLLESGMDRVGGYSGFWTRIEFNTAGGFEEIGAYE